MAAELAGGGKAAAFLSSLAQDFIEERASSFTRCGLASIPEFSSSGLH